MSSKTVVILEQLKDLTLLETAELVKQIEDTFNVDASPRPLIQKSVIDDSAYFQIIEDEIETDTAFDVVLEEVPLDKKIAILKEVRAITGLGLREAKDFVESVPNTVMFANTHNEAVNLKQKLEATGAKVSLK
ncbi:50S ribosomal protein L7/L12 [Mastigocoleus sp. MO_188.B34]|uniref:50S ribosomal protein L7/L12 n=1 Tax=Mastigocoleus sp. MO_188.B34 TaxID=3036635 RepID=UPI002619A52E|nr:50S ribosomal protein L7/L12 [Mastigocoleus sp. MO_188.B34]MDJ0697389.1 50S ribosomal protein L7/L12 [Mastigocoleus sp. MO_188.B34]